MRFFLSALFLSMATTVISAAEVKPLRVLIITGGCCHDYDNQGRVLAHGLAKRANVSCTVAQEINSSTAARIPLYDSPNWAEGYDVVIHDECFADVKDVDWLEKILKPHTEGVPAVVLHCAMHSYRAPTDAWFQFVGITSPGHGAHYPFEVKNVKAEHPVMKAFGEKWDAPKEELYYCDKLWPTATALGEAYSKERQADQTCIWTNMYGDTRVFGTTLGHYTETVGSPQYLDLIARGLLWSCHKLDDNGQPMEGYGPKQ